MPSANLGSSSIVVDVGNVVGYKGIALCPTATSAVKVSGTNTGVTGQANDTCITQVLIPAHITTATTVTLVGFSSDESGTAKNIVLTGSTSVDTLYDLGSIVNTAGAASVTVSAANGAFIWLSGAV